MGYTTRFMGRFHCYRAESKEAGQFLHAVYHGDRAALAAFADWLSEANDPRGDQIARIVAGPASEMTSFWRLFALKPEHASYLHKFSRTRRMRRDPAKARRFPDPIREAVGLPLGQEGAFFVGGNGYSGQDRDASILDYNRPPAGQPGLWCQWTPNEDGTAIQWNGAEKFYDYVEWLEYLIEHFLAPWGYVLNGKVDWQGEEAADRGIILVVHNRVTRKPLR